MKKLIIIIILWGLPIINVYSQTIGDYIIGQLVANNLAKEGNFIDEYNAIKSSTIENPYSLQQLEKNLNDKLHVQTKTKLFDPLISIKPTTDNQAEVIKFLNAIDSKLNVKQKSGTQFENVKSEIKRYFIQIQPSTGASDTMDSEKIHIVPSAEKTEPDQSNELPGFFSFKNFNIIHLLTFLILAWLALSKIFNLKKLFEKENESTNVDSDNKKLIEELNRTQNSISLLKDEFKKQTVNFNNLKSKVEDQDKTIQALKNQNIILPPVINSETGVYNSSLITPSTINQNDDSKNIFFMSSPVGNYFPDTNKSGSSINCVYEFDVDKLNNNNAVFKVIEDLSNLKSIMDNYNTYISPACEDSNNYNPSLHMRIKTDFPGEAKLEGREWVIKEKAKITYE